MHHIKQLVEEGIIFTNSRMVHRDIYATWISKVTGPEKTELLYTFLDWKSIWRNTAALKNTKIKETMFLFNHYRLGQEIIGLTATQTQLSVSAIKNPSPMSTLFYTVLVGKFLPFGWRGPSEPTAAAAYLWISSEDNLGPFGMQEPPSRSWLSTSTQRGRREGKEEHRLPMK